MKVTVILLLLVLTACDRSKVGHGLGDPCLWSEDCPAGMVCSTSQGGLCTIECAPFGDELQCGTHNCDGSPATCTEDGVCWADCLEELGDCDACE